MNIKFRKRLLNPKSTEVQEILSERLNKLCRFLNAEYNVNSGGCCYIAYCLAKFLSDDKFKFTLLVYSEDKLDKGNFKDLNYSCFHYALSLGNFYINSDGCDADDDLYETRYSKVKASDLLKHYKNGNWNCCYNKEKNDFLFKIIKTFYADLTEDLREKRRTSNSSR